MDFFLSVLNQPEEANPLTISDVSQQIVAFVFLKSFNDIDCLLLRRLGLNSSNASLS